MSSESRGSTGLVALLVVPLVVSLGWILIPQPARPWAEREATELVLVPVPAARSELTERVELVVERGVSTALLYGGPPGVAETLTDGRAAVENGEVVMEVGGHGIRAFVADRPLAGPVSSESPTEIVHGVAELLASSGLDLKPDSSIDPGAFASAVDAYARQEGWVPSEPGVFEPEWVIWVGPRAARLEMGVMPGAPVDPGQVVGQTVAPVLALVLSSEVPPDASLRVAADEIAVPADGRLTGQELADLASGVAPDAVTVPVELLLRPASPVFTVSTSSVVRDADGRTCVLRVPPEVTSSDDVVVRDRLERVPVEVLSGSPGVQAVVGELVEGDEIVGNVAIDGLPRGC